MNDPGQNSERWLNCQLDRGMFSDEMVVTYPPTGETIQSVFVPISFVRGTPGTQGKVRVLVMKRDGMTFALLPSSEQTIVRVLDNDVTMAP